MLHICPCFPGCMNIKREMQEWQLTRQEYRQTIETEVFSWDGRNYWSDNNFFSLGWWKKFYPASRPRYTRFWPSTDVSAGHGPDGHKFALCTLILTDRLEQVVHNRTDGRVCVSPRYANDRNNPNAGSQVHVIPRALYRCVTLATDVVECVPLCDLRLAAWFMATKVQALSGLSPWLHFGRLSEWKPLLRQTHLASASGFLLYTSWYYANCIYIIVQVIR